MVDYKQINNLKGIHKVILSNDISLNIGDSKLLITDISFIRINNGNIEFDVYLEGTRKHKLVCDYSQTELSNLKLVDVLTSIKLKVYEDRIYNKDGSGIQGVS